MLFWDKEKKAAQKNMNICMYIIIRGRGRGTHRE